MPHVRVGATTVREGDPRLAAVYLRFTLRLDRPTSRKTSVWVQTIATDATLRADFWPVNHRVRFGIGTVRRQVMVRVRGDRTHEQTERLQLRLTSGRGVHIAHRRGLGVIVDNDAELLGPMTSKQRTPIDTPNTVVLRAAPQAEANAVSASPWPVTGRSGRIRVAATGRRGCGTGPCRA